MLMLTADDFLLFVLVLAVELELGTELDDVALTVSCPKISVFNYLSGQIMKKKREYIVSPHYTTVRGQD
jgi:hypothetical protein